jgi:hypothetical protein
MARFGALIAGGASAFIALAALLLSLVTGSQASAEQAASTSVEAGLIWFSAGGFALLACLALVARMKLRARSPRQSATRTDRSLVSVEV